VFVYVFGQIVHRTIRIWPNILKPLFGTSLKTTERTKQISLDILLRKQIRPLKVSAC